MKEYKGPVVQSLEDYHKGYVYGGGNGTWAGSVGAADRRREEEQRRAKSNSSSSGSSNANTKVICTELNRQGLMSRGDYLLGLRFVQENLSEQHVRGYHAWGVPVVRQMRRSTRVTAFWRILAQARADHIANLYGDRSRRNVLGAVLCAVGHPTCYILGALTKEQDWQSLYGKEELHGTQ